MNVFISIVMALCSKNMIESNLN